MILCGRVVINLSREHWCLLNQSANVICRAPRNWNSVKHTGHWHRNPQKQRQNQHKFIANFQQFQTSTSNCSHHSLNQAPLGLSPTWCEQRTEPFGNLKCSNARMATRQHVDTERTDLENRLKQTAGKLTKRSFGHMFLRFQWLSMVCLRGELSSLITRNPKFKQRGRNCTMSIEGTWRSKLNQSKRGAIRCKNTSAKVLLESEA